MRETKRIQVHTHTQKMTMVATLINKTICIRGSNKFASLVRLGEGKKPCT